MVDSVLEVQNIKLPDSGGTTGADVFTSTGNVPTIASGVTFPAGHVLQVVKGTVPTTADTFTSSTPAASSIYVNITPLAASSKIYISTTFHADTQGGTNLWAALFRTVASGTPVNLGANGGTANGHYYLNNLTYRILAGASIVYLDSPSYTLTDTIRYSVYCATQGALVQLRHDLQTSQIIAMEIKG